MTILLYRHLVFIAQLKSATYYATRSSSRTREKSTTNCCCYVWVVVVCCLHMKGEKINQRKYMQSTVHSTRKKCRVSGIISHESVSSTAVLTYSSSTWLLSCFFHSMERTTLTWCNINYQCQIHDRNNERNIKERNKYTWSSKHTHKHVGSRQNATRLRGGAHRVILAAAVPGTN